MPDVLNDDACMRSSLPGALERGEIEAWFQPQIDLASRDIVGAEALCRWNAGDRGHVPPTVFIPLAEEMGLIDAIGLHMAEVALVALDEWAQLETPIDVAVNVSPVQLHTPIFTDWIGAALRRMRLVDRRLTLEITESEPVRDPASVVGRLDELRELGLGVAIDDFGSGHSTLHQLRELHGTELKLDRSLIEESDADDDVTQFLRDVVGMAHGSGIRVVAEGIETEAQLDRMTEIGCDRAQGYLLGRPMPKLELTELLATR